MTDFYKNLFIVSGFVAKPLSIREISKGRHNLIIVLRAKNIHGEECFLRFVSYSKKVIDHVVAIGVTEGCAISITGHNDVLKWDDIKSKTSKSRQSLIMDSVEILKIDSEISNA